MRLAQQLFLIWVAVGTAAMGPTEEKSPASDPPPPPRESPALLRDMQDTSHFAVVPKQRLMLCWMEKVGCETFIDLFCSISKRHKRDATKPARTYLYGHKSQDFEEGCNWTSASPIQHGMDLTQVADALGNPAWTKAVFYRDPLDRFLSGYLSKCTPGHDQDTYFCRQVFGSVNPSFEEAAAVIRYGTDRATQAPRRPLFLPPHRAPTPSLPAASTATSPRDTRRTTGGCSPTFARAL